MTIATLKPVLLVIVVALLAMTLVRMPGSDSTPIRASLSLYFGRAVDECQEAHPEWDREVCAGVVRGDIWVGMDKEMIRASIGEPDDIDFPDAENSDRESWTYKSKRLGMRVLEIEDDLLTGWGLPDPGCSTCGTTRPDS